MSTEFWKQYWKAADNGDNGTEKIDDFMKRSFDFCDMVSKEYIGKNVLIVTHAANVRAISYYFLGRPNAYDFNKTLIKNGELITFDN